MRIHCYAGLFFIVTRYDNSGKNVYFKVEDSNITATTNKHEATRFYIKHEEGNHFRVSPYDEEMSSGDLSHFQQNSSNKGDLGCVPTLYLTAVVNWRGYSCPLQLRQLDTSDHRAYSYLAFCKQKAQSSEDIELVESERWLKGKDSEAFYIKCSLQPDLEPDTSGNSKCSYLYIQQKMTWRRQIFYSTGCAPSIKHHNKQGRSMLFKLLKVSNSGPADGSGGTQSRAKSEQRVAVDCESVTLTPNEGQGTELKEAQCHAKLEIDAMTLF